MVIQVRGTSGSGKTTIVRSVMDSIFHWQGHYVPGRKKPLYYYTGPEMGDWPRCVVLGHYESPCGGCDTIGSAASVYSLIEEIREGNGDVPILCEGLLLSEDVKWTSQMGDVRCLFLTTPIERCIDQIRSRRSMVGNDKPLDEKNTRNRVLTIERARRRLLELGVDCRRVSPSQAPKQILGWVREFIRGEDQRG